MSPCGPMKVTVCCVHIYIRIASESPGSDYFVISEFDIEAEKLATPRSDIDEAEIKPCSGIDRKGSLCKKERVTRLK